jgi:hypothetical protein
MSETARHSFALKIQKKGKKTLKEIIVTGIQTTEHRSSE